MLYLHVSAWQRQEVANQQSARSNAGALHRMTLRLSVPISMCRYYQRYECQRPELHFSRGSALMERVLRACPLLREPYRPTFWATNPHVQTMMSVLRKLSIRANFRRHLLPAPDGGTVGASAAEISMLLCTATATGGADCPGTATSASAQLQRCCLHSQALTGTACRSTVIGECYAGSCLLGICLNVPPAYVKPECARAV